MCAFECGTSSETILARERLEDYQLRVKGLGTSCADEGIEGYDVRRTPALAARRCRRSAQRDDSQRLAAEFAADGGLRCQRPSRDDCTAAGALYALARCDALGRRACLLGRRPGPQSTTATSRAALRRRAALRSKYGWHPSDDLRQGDLTDGTRFQVGSPVGSPDRSRGSRRAGLRGIFKTVDD